MAILCSKFQGSGPPWILACEGLASSFRHQQHGLHVLVCRVARVARVASIILLWDIVGHGLQLSVQLCEQVLEGGFCGSNDTAVPRDMVLAGTPRRKMDELTSLLRACCVDCVLAASATSRTTVCLSPWTLMQSRSCARACWKP